MICQEREVQDLQNRIKDLERQLAEAEATIAALAPSKRATERPQTTESLRVAHEEAIWLARFPGENPNPVARISEEGIVLYRNPPAANLPGWTCVVNDPLPLPLRSLVHQALTQGRILEQEVTLGTRTYSISIVPILEEGYANLYGRDVTEHKRAEKALKESEHRQREIARALELDQARLAAVLRHLPVGVWIFDQQGRLISNNEQVERTWAGESPLNDITDLPKYVAWHPESGQLLKPEEYPIAVALRTGQPVEAMEINIRRFDGSQGSLLVSAVPIKDSQGQLMGGVEVNIDITERKRMEEALRESEERFAKAFHASPNALVISRQTDGLIETVNDTFVEFFGYSREEVIGKTSTELHMFVNPEDRREAVRGLQRDGSIRDFELDVRLKSGEVRNISLSVEAMNLGGENMMLTMIQDITIRKQAEAALRASEERYRAVVENALDAIVVTDPSRKGKVLAVNPAACSMFGYSAEEFLGVDRQAILDTSDPRLAAFLKHRKRRGQVTGQLTYKRKDGTRFSGELSSVFYQDKNGEQRAVAIIRNVTEREQIETALRKRESILTQAGKIAHLGAWDIEFHDQDDVNANPLAWSEEVYRIFGYAPGEVKPSNDLFFERVHPDDRKLVQESIAKAIATRQPYVIEHRICRPDGEERIVQEHAEVFFSEAGAPLRIVGAVQDVTERRRAEEASRASEKRFRSLADSMPQLVWMAQPDGTVDYYNSRYLEYQEIKQVEDTAWEWAPVLHPEDLELTVQAWRHSVATGEIYQIEHRVRMTDGSYRWHLSRGVPMLDEEGRVIRWFGTATDIHDLKLAERQLKEYASRLERSNQELEQFAFYASHDLQEPLRKIEVFGDLLLERSMSLNGRERSYLDRMRLAAGRMRDMVEGLLQLSRVTTQGKPFAWVNLSQVTSEVLSDLEEQIRRAEGRVDFEALPGIEGDPLQLRQLMQNLIGNALKYHQPGTPPEVKIYAKQLPEKVQILVEDHGIGFAQEEAERIFQPFQRLVGRSQYDGSGIGLAICRRIVERHRGEILARSQPGQGTTIVVTLPIYPPESIRNESRKEVHDEDPGAAPGR